MSALAEKWQHEWQKGMEEYEGKTAISPCRQVELIGALAKADDALRAVAASPRGEGLPLDVVIQMMEAIL